MAYYTFYFNEDGDSPTLHRFATAMELEEYLRQNEFSEFLNADSKPELSQETGLLIIKGEAVVPTPRDIVKSWSV